jgi:hypothetical protein
MRHYILRILALVIVNDLLLRNAYRIPDFQWEFYRSLKGYFADCITLHVACLRRRGWGATNLSESEDKRCSPDGGNRFN